MGILSLSEYSVCENQGFSNPESLFIAQVCTGLVLEFPICEILMDEL